MKLRLFLMAMLCAFLMASCSDEMSKEEGGKVLESETTTFIRLSLIGDGATRADDSGVANSGVDEPGYENGTVDESAVNSLLLTFFDKDKNYVGKTFINVNDGDNVEFNGNGNTVERFLSVVASVTLPQNSNHPVYVVAYVNPTSAYADLVTDKLEDALKYIRSRSQVSPSGFRTMNNSMYFKDDEICFATVVDFNKCFFKTKEEANAATDANSIIVTVERMEAKVRLSTPLSDMKVNKVNGESSASDKYELKFVPEAWFVNGTEKRSFLLKNYRTTRENYKENIVNDFDSYNLENLNLAFRNPIGDFSVNDINNKRSYWAIDPTYFYEANSAENDVYPDVSYDVKVSETINKNGKTYPLKYRSYSEVLEEYAAQKSTNVVKFNGNVKTDEYVLENTMSLTTLRSTDAKASMTSVVLLGHYVITKGTETVFDGGAEVDNTKAFYVSHEDKDKKIVMLSDAQAIDHFLERNNDILFVQKRDANGDIIANEYIPLTAAVLADQTYRVSATDFYLKYPEVAVTGDKIESEQWRTIKVNAQNANIFVALSENNETVYKPINTEGLDMAALESRLYQKLGKIERFESGKAYFNVPLKHIWGKLDATANQFKPEEVRLGDYGVVRNHIYDLTINGISGLGTGIGDIKQPIIPPTENELYYINTKINILKWRLVKQSIDL